MNATARPWQLVGAMVLAALLLLGTVVGAVADTPDDSIEAAAVGYYVDSNRGSDSNSGTSPNSPWRSLAPVNSRSFAPGDTIHFAAGSTFSGGLVINSSGAQGNPITFTTYGEGPKPIFRASGDNSNAVSIRGSWVVVDGFFLTAAGYAGVRIDGSGRNNVVRNCEATDVGIGVAIHGQYNLVTRNYLHDLKMVRNTPGGDDDYGAVGVWFFGSNNEASYNRIERATAHSYDYRTDGGGFEWYGTADNNYVHHNWVADSNGFLEVGGGSARDAVVAYNVSVNNGMVAYFHLSGNFAADVRNFRFENNTIVDTAARDAYAVISFRSDPSPDTFIMRNNIFYIGGFYTIASRSGFSHSHNLFHLVDSRTQLGFNIGEGEHLGDPLFVDVAARNFRLQAGSPAIECGIPLGHTADFDGLLISTDTRPAAGAFQFAEPGTAPATPTPQPGPQPTATPVPPIQAPDPGPGGDLPNRTYAPVIAR